MELSKLGVLLQFCVYFANFVLISANSDSFSNPQEVLESCAVPGANNKFGARIRGPELNVKIRQFPFMASYGYLQGISKLKPSLFMKIFSSNNFTTKLLSKLHSNLYIGVHLKGTKKFGRKLINRHFFLIERLGSMIVLVFGSFLIALSLISL